MKRVHIACHHADWGRDWRDGKLGSKRWEGRGSVVGRGRDGGRPVGVLGCEVREVVTGGGWVRPMKGREGVMGGGVCKGLLGKEVLKDLAMYVRTSVPLAL